MAWNMRIGISFPDAENACGSVQDYRYTLYYKLMLSSTGSIDLKVDLHAVCWVGNTKDASCASTDCHVGLPEGKSRIKSKFSLF